MSKPRAASDKSPRAVAENIRALWGQNKWIPATTEEFFQWSRRGGPRLHAFDAVFMVSKDAGCTMAEAREIVEELIPQLWADYWIAKWDADPRAAGPEARQRQCQPQNEG